MENLTAQTKKKIIEALQKKGARLPCPRCATNDFTLLDGYFNQPIQQDLKAFAFGPSVPSIIVICNECGYISQHALGALGLLPVEKAIA